MTDYQPTDQYLEFEDLPPLLSYQQVADYLGCSKATVRDLVRAKRLTVYRLSHKLVRIPKEQLAALLAAT